MKENLISEMPEIFKCPSARLTDKGDINHTFLGLSYLDIYDSYFRHLRFDPITLLEIGVSGQHDQVVGSSLWLWREYFPNATIIGFDIDPFCKKYEKQGIHIEIGNQSVPEDIDKVKMLAPNGFDIIIDDGSHVNEYTLLSFKHLFPSLNKNGFYVIEDLGCSYGKIEDWGCREWPGMKFNTSENLNNDRLTMDSFFKEMITKLDIQSGDVLSTHFWSMMCVIIKGIERGKI